MGQRHAETKAAQAAQNGATVFAGLMDFSLSEPRAQVYRLIERELRQRTGDLAEMLTEQLRQAYIAGVSDGYRQALVEGEND